MAFESTGDVSSYNQSLWAEVDKDLHARILAGDYDGPTLRAFRQSLGFSLAELGGLTGYTRQLIHQMENGREPVTDYARARLRQLAQRLQTGLFEDAIPPRGRFPLVVQIEQRFIRTDQIRAKSGNWRKCLECQKSFYAISTKTKYCSNSCKNKHARKWKGKKDPADTKPRARRVEPSAAAVRCPNCAHVFRAKGNVVFLDPHAGDGGGAPDPQGQVGPNGRGDPLPAVAG